MTDFYHAPTYPKAKKEHRCIYCGGPILVEERYVQQEGFYDGKPYRNRYHQECFDTCIDDGKSGCDWEFTPYEGEYPERVRLIVEARRENLFIKRDK